MLENLCLIIHESEAKLIFFICFGITVLIGITTIIYVFRHHSKIYFFYLNGVKISFVLSFPTWIDGKLMIDDKVVCIHSRFKRTRYSLIYSTQDVTIEIKVVPETCKKTDFPVFINSRMYMIPNFQGGEQLDLPEVKFGKYKEKKECGEDVVNKAL